MNTLKSTAAVVTDVNERKGIVTAYWSAFENVDHDGDIIRRGAYAKTIAERGPEGADRIKFLWQHDVHEPIGRPLWLVEDSNGLLAETKIAETTRGRDVLILYEEGVIDRHSVGIDILKRDDSDRRVIREVRLWEGSAVTFAANEMTPVVGMKDAGGSAYLERVQKALRRPLSDETARLLEKALGSAAGTDDPWLGVLAALDEYLHLVKEREARYR